MAHKIFELCWFTALVLLVVAGSILNDSYAIAASCCDKAGDANNDGTVNIGDAVFIINYIFKGGDAPQCLAEEDANADGAVNVGDAVYIINYIFKGGPEPMCYKKTRTINIADTGPGSLRAAIDSANANSGADTLTFTVSGTIALLSPLPALADDSTVILGSTAPGSTGSVILDGTSISGGGDGLVVQSRDNLIDGLTIRNFPGNGISVTGVLSVRNRLSRNVIYNNNGLAIDLGADGVTTNDPGDGDTGPNDMLNYPEIDSVFMNPDSSFLVYGRAADGAIIEFFVAHPVGDASKPADPSGHGEAYAYAVSDTAGISGDFIAIIPKPVGQFSVISATATDSLENTSEFCQNAIMTPAPLVVVAYSPVNIIVEDPLMRRFGRDSLDSDITDIPGGHYFITPHDSVVIDHPIGGTYIVQFVTEAGIPIGATYSAIIMIDGTQQLIIAANKSCSASGEVDATTYMVEEGYHYLNGDANRDNILNLNDIYFLQIHIFYGGPPPYPYLAGDADCNGIVDIQDTFVLFNYLYKGGHPPCYFEH